jgi:Family of unknown function (DUF6221)
VSGDELVPWLRRRIRERRYLAVHAIELGNAAVWTEQSSGVLVTGEPTETDHWHGTWATGDSSLTRLMEANDPRDTIARCEFELALLDEHKVIRMPCRDARGVPGHFCECATCGFGGPDRSYPCKTVRLLGYGYRFRPGYRKEWRP